MSYDVAVAHDETVSKIPGHKMGTKGARYVGFFALCDWALPKVTAALHAYAPFLNPARPGTIYLRPTRYTRGPGTTT
jgi:hypothetical protein